MKTRKKLGAILASLALGLGLTVATTVKADAWDQATKFTFSQPVEIPGQTLPAGTYWFKLIGGLSNPNVVQVYDASRTQFIANIPSIPIDHIFSVNDTEVTLAKPSDTRPAALLTWFYPGEAVGHEFYYTPSERDRLSEQQHFTVKAEPMSSHGVILNASLH